MSEATSLLVRDFREAMSCFPSGVAVVTTADEAGRWWGVTVSAFCSVSVDPPTVLFCLDEAASCRDAFHGARSWAVNVLSVPQERLARLFATRGADKFSQDSFDLNADGHPVLPAATFVLGCHRRAVHAAGDHSIVVGEVREVRLGSAPAAVYLRRAFGPGSRP
jgi:flavin reductase ActVB